ncbi:DUF6864 domain-containing function [Caballeronia sp. INML1]|uniref:DUF6864 domain-containing function n=1 Tax=Caballeronia sp. INML1 TaxID=2921760 RepID=UPI002029450B|nr:hypothetical protein [Caballeronia sp. INML1]
MSSPNISGGIASATSPIPIKLVTAGRDVIASGSVITGNNSNLEVYIAQFRFVFNFLVDGATHKVAYRNDGPTTLILDLYNFVDALPAGTTEPVKMGKLLGRQLYVSFFVSALGPTSSKSVTYTFSLGEAVA